MKKDYHSSTIQRALNILNLFKDHPSMSFSEIRKTLGFHKATLYRVISTLHDNGYLKKDESRRYELGLNVFILGNQILKESPLINVSTPFMNELSQDLGLTGLLGVLNGTNVVIIQKTDPNRLIKMVCHVGGSIPAHCTAQGKVLLAYSSKETTQKVIDVHGLQRYTPHTICTTEAFLAELEAIRTHGYAVDNGEHEKNVRCIGVPILDKIGRIEAALSVTGTIIDLPDGETITKTANILIEVRDRIRKELGYLETSSPPIQKQNGSFREIPRK
jgi:IclR family pca regulon transcriptional regulator